MKRDAPGTGHRDDHEPAHHHRPEQRPDALGAPGLDHEQGSEDDSRQRDDKAGQARVWKLKALHCRQHGYGGRNDRIAVEQAGPYEADHRDGACRPGPVPRARRTNAERASTPPSPLLSARRTTVTYLTDTMMVSDHTTIEMIPSTSLVVGPIRPPSMEKTVWTAYSGLVPMSP